MKTASAHIYMRNWKSLQNSRLKHNSLPASICIGIRRELPMLEKIEPIPWGPGRDQRPNHGYKVRGIIMRLSSPYPGPPLPEVPVHTRRISPGFVREICPGPPGIFIHLHQEKCSRPRDLHPYSVSGVPGPGWGPEIILNLSYPGTPDW